MLDEVIDCHLQSIWTRIYSRAFIISILIYLSQVYRHIESLGSLFLHCLYLILYKASSSMQILRAKLDFFSFKYLSFVSLNPRQVRRLRQVVYSAKYLHFRNCISHRVLLQAH